MITIVREGRKQEIARYVDKQRRETEAKKGVRMRERIGSCGIIASERVGL